MSCHSMDFRLFGKDLKVGVTSLVGAGGDVTVTHLVDLDHDLDTLSRLLDSHPVLDFVRAADYVVRTFYIRCSPFNPLR